MTKNAKAIKTHVVFLFVAGLFIACNPIQENQAEHHSMDIPQSKAPGVIPNEVSLTAMASLPHQYTWRDIDDFYHTALPKYVGTDYYDNLRELALFHLVFPFEFEREADKAALEYYFKEMQEVDLMDPKAFIIVAVALFQKGWTKEAVREAAYARYVKNMETLKSLDNPESAMKKYADKHQNLLRFAENLPNRWGSY